VQGQLQRPFDVTGELIHLRENNRPYVHVVSHGISSLGRNGAVAWPAAAAAPRRRDPARYQGVMKKAPGPARAGNRAISVTAVEI
jgi:hypothetical protein